MLNPHTINQAVVDGLPGITDEMTVLELEDVHGLPLVITVDGPGVHVYLGRAHAVLDPKTSDRAASALLAASSIARQDAES